MEIYKATDQAIAMHETKPAKAPESFVVDPSKQPRSKKAMHKLRRDFLKAYGIENGHVINAKNTDT